MEAVPSLGSVAIFLRAGILRMYRRHRKRGADRFGIVPALANRADPESLREVHDMGGVQRLPRLVAAGRVHAGQIAQDRENPRLVEHHPVFHAIAQPIGDDRGVVGEMLRGVAIRPSARIFERLRQVPMEQRDERPDLAPQQLVDHAAIEVETLLIDRAAALRLDSRPRNRDSRGIEAKLGHQRDILAVAMIVIASDVAGVAVLDLARGVAEAIPDRLALAVLVPRAFDLVRGAGGAPLEALGKCQRCHARMVSTLRSGPKWKHCPTERQ